MSKPMTFSKKDSLEAVTDTSHLSVKVSNNIDSLNELYLTSLKIILKNNTTEPLTDVRIVIPPTELGILESPTTLRFPYISQKTSDSIFQISDIASGEKGVGTLYIYARKSGIYKIKADIETAQRVRATTNIVTVKAE